MRRWLLASCCLTLTLILTLPDIDPRHISLATAHSPAHYPRQLPHPAYVTHQGAASVTSNRKNKHWRRKTNIESFTLASILALLSSGADKPRMEKKFGPQSRISNQMLKLHKGIIQPCLSHPILANILINDGDINLLIVGLGYFKFELLKTTLIPWEHSGKILPVHIGPFPIHWPSTSRWWSPDNI